MAPTNDQPPSKGQCGSSVEVARTWRTTPNATDTSASNTPNAANRGGWANCSPLVRFEHSTRFTASAVRAKVPSTTDDPTWMLNNSNVSTSAQSNPAAAR